MNLFEVLAILMLIVGFVIGAVTAFEDSNFNHGARYMMRWERVTTVSDKASCVNFLGDRTIFWGDGMRIQAFSGAGGRVSRAIPLERGSTRHTTTWRGFRKRSRRDGNGVRNGPA